jgi:hypothetical protein
MIGLDTRREQAQFFAVSKMEARKMTPPKLGLVTD